MFVSCFDYCIAVNDSHLVFSLHNQILLHRLHWILTVAVLNIVISVLVSGCDCHLRATDLFEKGISILLID